MHDIFAYRHLIFFFFNFIVAHFTDFLFLLPATFTIIQNQSSMVCNENTHTVSLPIGKRKWCASYYFKTLILEVSNFSSVATDSRALSSAEVVFIERAWWTSETLAREASEWYRSCFVWYKRFVCLTKNAFFLILVVLIHRCCCCDRCVYCCWYSGWNRTIQRGILIFFSIFLHYFVNRENLPF